MANLNGVALNDSDNSFGGLKPKEIIKEIVKLDPLRRSFTADRGRQHVSEIQEVKQVEKSLKVKLDMAKSSDGTMTIIIKGTAERVKEAKRELGLRLGKTENEKVEVPQPYIGHIIGSGGSQIRQIEANTGVKISIDKNNSGPAIFSIYGKTRSVREAKSAILTLLSEKKDRVSEDVLIPRSLRPIVYGLKNKRIDEWREKFGIFIRHSSEGVVLTGAKSKVDALVFEIGRLVEELERDCQTLNLAVERRRMSQLCSNKNLLKELLDFVLEKTEVAVWLGDGEMLITGRVTKLGEALTLLLCKINAHVFDDVEVPAWMYRHLKKDIAIHHSFKGGVLTLDGPPEVVDEAKENLEEAIFRISQELVCEAIPVSRIHHSQIIGRRGAVVKGISSTYSVDINFSKDDLVIVEGSPTNVVLAKEHILQMVAGIEVETKYEIPVPSHLHCHILEADKVKSFAVMVTADSDKLELKGPSSVVSECARVVKDLSSQLSKIYKSEVLPISDSLYLFLRDKRHILRICSKTGVDVVRRGEGLVVTGKTEQVTRAMELFEEIGGFNGSSVNVESLEMSSPVWGALLSRGEVERAEEKFKVGIDFDGTACRISGSQMNKCKSELAKVVARDDYGCACYSGVMAGSFYYKKEIDRICRDFDVYVSGATVVGKKAKLAVAEIQRICSGQCQSTTVEIGDEVADAIFRRRDTICHRIEADYKVFLKRNGAQVFIFGSRTDIEKAEDGLRRITEDLKSHTTTELSINKNHVGAVIGHGGKNLRRISQKYAVIIDLKDRKETPRIMITGSVLDCEDAKEDILDCIPTVEIVDIDSGLHSRLIGAGGARIADLCKKFDVNVKFNDTSTVEVRGRRWDVDAAIKYLNEQADAVRQESERRANSYSKTLRVKSLHMGRIIGRKGTSIANFRKKHNVEVKVEGEEGGSFLTIFGDQSNVETAHSVLFNMVASMDAEVSFAFEVPSSFHPILIGRGGRRIREIMTKFGVSVSFSKSVENQVEIVGMPNSVSECTEYIQSLVDENEDYGSKEVKAVSLADYL